MKGLRCRLGFHRWVRQLQADGAEAGTTCARCAACRHVWEHTPLDAGALTVGPGLVTCRFCPAWDVEEP